MFTASVFVMCAGYTSRNFNTSMNSGKERVVPRFPSPARSIFGLSDACSTSSRRRYMDAVWPLQNAMYISCSSFSASEMLGSQLEIILLLISSTVPPSCITIPFPPQSTVLDSNNSTAPSHTRIPMARSLVTSQFFSRSSALALTRTQEGTSAASKPSCRIFTPLTVTMKRSCGSIRCNSSFPTCKRVWP